MEKIYLFETIEECEKQIKDKNMIIDIGYSCNANTLDSLFNTISTIILVIAIGFVIKFAFISTNLKYVLLTIGIWLAACFVFATIIRLIKVNHYKGLVHMKQSLVNNSLESCKEFQESNYDEWVKTQICKKLYYLAGCKFEFDSNNAK